MSTLPLSGLKVLDFSWALVGSITTKNLADYGAEVIKVESTTRPCLSRIDAQVSVSTRQSFDDKPWFMHMNTSKKSLRLNMKHPRWREVIDPLIDWADVVVENFSPGTMASLGLDYAALSARKPGIVMLSGSVFGQSGPMAKGWGVDGTGAALSGRLFMTGWADRSPIGPSAVPYGDVVLPPFMAAAVAAAVERQRRTGQGCHIDASMYEVCVAQMAPALVADQRGDHPYRDGNRDARALIQGVYPCAGEDRWIAISCASADEWRRLIAEMEADGAGDWPDAAALAEADSIALDGLDARIGAWTIGFDRYALMERLQSAGVAAGAVQEADDLLERDPQLRARGFVESLVSPVLGAFEHQALPYKLSRTPARMSPAPSIGQHNREILEQILGLSPDACDDLAASENLFE